MGKLRLSLILLIVFVSLTVYLLWQLRENRDMTTLQKFFMGKSLLICGLLSVLFWDVSRRRVSPYHTYGSAFGHYVSILSLHWIGWFMKKKLENDTKYCRETQDQLLLRRMIENANTEYGKTYKFSEINSRETYVASHPLTGYDRFEPYIQRQMKGEENVLTVEKPIMFGVTSGTSGKSRELPFLKKNGTYFFFHAITIVYECLLDAFPEAKSLQKSLKFFYTPRWRTCEAGVPVGPNSSSPTNSKRILHMYSTPAPGYEILTEPEALYIHFLFAMKDKTLGIIEANFSSLVFYSFKTLEGSWKDIVNDIEKGEIKKTLNIDENVRSRLMKYLKPDPVRAAELRLIFAKGNVGLVQRIWPRMSLILCSSSGAFELYADMLQKTYCKDIAMYSPMYAASEGVLGINIWPKVTPSRYLLLPSSMFFEFIPEERFDEEQPETLFIDQVEIGSVYEVVITNKSGLYRYRFGDVVRVTSFYNRCPVIEFMYRKGQFLNVRGEKTSEAAFFQALMEAMTQWTSSKLIDYCCVESGMLNETRETRSSSIPHYHVFIELDSSSGEPELTEKEKVLIDDMLCQQSYVYGSFRKKNSIGPMEIHLLKPGTFSELREFTINTTAASSIQYKVPRVLKKKEALKFIMERVI